MFQNSIGKYDLEVTTFQMAVLFAWNQRQNDKVSFESLRYIHVTIGVFIDTCVGSVHIGSVPPKNYSV